MYILRYLFSNLISKITIALLLVIVVFLTAFKVNEYRMHRNVFISELQARGEKITGRLATNLVVPLWELDENWVRKIIDSEMTDESVYAIIVQGGGYLNEGKKRDLHWKPVEATGVIAGDFVIHSGDVVRGDATIGSLTIYVTKQFMENRLREDAKYAFLTTLLLSIVLMLFLVLQLNKIIIQPLQQVLATAKAIAKGDYGHDIEISQRDEVGMLGHEVNLMKKNISLREQELDNTIQQLKLKSQELEKELVVRKEAEKALKESEEKYIDLYDNAPDMYGSVDRKSALVIQCNQTLANELGYTKEEIVGQPIFTLYQPDCMEEVERCFHKFVETGTVHDAELQLMRKDGSKLEVSLSVSSVRDEQGAICYSRSTWRDITERKYMENELLKLNEELEQRVKDRTQELAHSKEAAETANQAKSVFLANMSHELRTPLNAVLGFSQLMQNDKTISKSQRDNLDIINRSGSHLLQLINDVLDMSKIEAGRTVLETEDFDLGEMVRNTIDMMRINAEAKGLQLLLDQTSRFPRFVHGDCQKLRQILINILSNAVKFTSVGGVSLRLDAVNGHPDTITLRAEVEDSGPGMKPDDIHRIFVPFERLTATGGLDGTGLGLAITRQFIKMMGGEIEVESKPGHGSLFRFTLQVQAAKGDVEPIIASETRQIIGLSPGQNEYRILIAEDQLDNQLLLQRLLESVGFKVRIAQNGEESIRIFQEWNPHFIWMDQRMPVMDGLEATRRIKAMPGGKSTVIVAITASVFKENKDRVMESGANDFVRKPYNPEEIFDCMAKHLGVRYLYGEDKAPADKGVTKMEASPEAFATLPDELLAELRSAAVVLDVEQGMAVIGRIEKLNPTLASDLRRFVEAFDFKTIQKLLRQADK